MGIISHFREFLKNIPKMFYNLPRNLYKDFLFRRCYNLIYGPCVFVPILRIFWKTAFKLLFFIPLQVWPPIRIKNYKKKNPGRTWEIICLTWEIMCRENVLKNNLCSLDKISISSNIWRRVTYKFNLDRRYIPVSFSKIDPIQDLNNFKIFSM